MTSLTNICHTYHIYLKEHRPQISAAPSQQQCEGYLLLLLDTFKAENCYHSLLLLLLLFSQRRMMF